MSFGAESLTIKEDRDMKSITTRCVVRAVFQVVLGVLVASECPAQLSHDSDWPNGMELAGEGTVLGNPLDDGDVVFGLRGTHRFVRGDLGLELGLHHAEPTSDFVRSLGRDAELFLLELSVVWYPNYESWYRRAAAKDPWHDSKRLKPELVVFGGPGWGSLRIDDAFPGFPLSDASRDYLVLHAGVGAKIHWFVTDPNRGWDHKTSRWYVRPEVRGRWFAGEDGDVDWTVGLALGVSFGRRPSRLACELNAREATRAARIFLAQEVDPAVDRVTATQTADELSKKARAHLDHLEELKAHAVTCGPRCADVRDQLDEVIRELNDALSRLRPGVS